jgi:glycosyltransferase involved in cell wall biosynthesis
VNSRPIKIVRLITRLNIGGPSLHVVTLSAELPPERFTTLLVCGRVDPGEGDMSDLALERGVTPFVIPCLHREFSPADDLRSLAAVAGVLRRERPDILHTHLSKAGALGRAAAALCPGLRTVHTFHGNVLRGYFSPRRTRLYLLLERALALRTDRLIALGDSQRDEMLHRYRVGRPEQYAVVPLGLDLGRFTRCEHARGQLRKELGIPSGIPVVSTVGRLVPIKDHNLFLDAARYVRGEKTDAVFLIVGDGLCRRELEERARGLGLGGSVRFIGWRRDLERIYADSDIVVLTSVNEGTPVSLIEAAAAGVPVVATDVGGVRDVVRDGESGLLTGTRDPREIAARIGELIDDPARARSMGEAGRRHVGVRFAKGRLLDDIARLYAELMGE